MKTRSLGGAPGVPCEIHADAGSLGESLAMRLAEAIHEASAAKRLFILGCPAGRSLQSTYLALARQVATRDLDLSGLIIAMMDEYVIERGSGFDTCPPSAHYSCHRFATLELQQRLNQGRARARQVASEHVWIPNPSQPEAYDARIRHAGGIDWFLLASGASDGHVAFNPTGTSGASTTRIVGLAEDTRRDNLATFPGFRTLDEVPRHGVSVGLGSIVTLSRHTVLVIHGVHKRHAVARLASMDDFTPLWPASIIYRCPDPRILLDHASANDI